MGLEKNVAGQKWIVFAFDRTDNTPKAGDLAQITAEISIDAAAGSPLGDASPVEIEDGYYYFDLTQAETNGDMLTLLPESSTADIQVIGVPGTVFTVAENFNVLGVESDGDLTQVNTATNVSQLGGQAVTAAAGITINAEVGGSTTSMNNFELMYNGTGYTDETAPSSRSQVDGIGAASGAALSYEASADNTSAPIDPSSVGIVGTITANLYTDTPVEDGVRHQLTGTATAFDFVYLLPVGGGRTAANMTWKGYLTSANDDCDIQAYNHVGASWDTIGSIGGTGNTINGTIVVALISRHTGTGSELGNIYIRFVCTGQTSPVLNTDLLLVDAVNIGQTVGYENGAVWVDTVNGAAGTESYVNGTADNKVNLFSSAITIAGNVGLHHYEMSPDSTVTLGATLNNSILDGHGWTLDLNTNDVDLSHFLNCSVGGVGTAATGMEFHSCEVETCSVQKCDMYDCTLDGTISLTAAGNYNFVNCQGGVAGVSSPTIALSAVAITAEFHRWSGGIIFSGLTSDDSLTISGELGTINLGSPASAATIEILGTYKSITNIGSASVNTDGAVKGEDVASILVDTGTTIPAILGTPADTDLATDIVNVQTDTTAILTKLPFRPTRATAFTNFTFLMVDSTDHVTAQDSLTVTPERSIDGGAFSSTTNAVVEISDGWYKINLSAADLTGDVIALKFTATGADARNIQIITQTS